MTLYAITFSLVHGWGQTPIEIRPGVSQLFVNDTLIQSATGLVRTLHCPQKDAGGEAPILELMGEYGVTPSTLEANGSIVYDPRLEKYVMFALAFSPSTSGEERIRLYRFTSNDGLDWIKGDDGSPEPIRFNLVDLRTGTKAPGHDLFSCYYDTRDPIHPYKGWLYCANWGDLEGLYFVRSKDGKSWELGPMISRAMSRQIVQDGRNLGGPADVSLFYRDEASGQFLASLKFFSRSPVGPKNHLRSRAYMFVRNLEAPLDLSRLKRVELIPPAEAAGGEQPHDEYYASTAWRYESVWLGGLKVWHGGGDYPYSAAGCAFLKLAVSQDGLHWQKVAFTNDQGVPEVFIANGPEGGNGGRNDGGYITEFSQGPLRVGDELIYYYGASSYGKNETTGKRVSGGGIFRSRLRPDGFVSVDGGTLTTMPLRFKGHHLFVNGQGPITATLVDDRGKRMAVSEIAGDSLRHVVSFGGKTFGRVTHGRPVRIRFNVQPGGHLYSFQVQ